MESSIPNKSDGKCIMKDYIRRNLRRLKRLLLIKYYGLKNVHPTFLASFYLGGVDSQIHAGAYSYIGPKCEIYPNVYIGNYTMLAGNIRIIGGDHNFKNPNIPIVFNGRAEIKKTVIGDDVWIGSNCTIMCGVRIGDGAIIAAGSVVCKDVGEYEIHGGNPAKKIKDRFSEEEKIAHRKMLRKSPDEIVEYSNLLTGKIK